MLRRDAAGREATEVRRLRQREVDLGRRRRVVDPRDGRPGGTWQLVSVAADSAALADGLTTAFCLMDKEAIATVLTAYPDATLEALL